MRKTPAWVLKLKRGDVIYRVERKWNPDRQRHDPWAVVPYTVRKGFDPTFVHSQALRLAAQLQRWALKGLDTRASPRPKR